MMKSAAIKSNFSLLLLRWYDANIRPFPWRTTRDPYRIWLSEIMLQQTRTKTVIQYYNDWLNVFPNVNAVAKSDLESILKKWEGLGYYARARNFYAACKVIMDHFGGKIPKNYDDFLSLPGVGPYTAGAVMSIAHKLPLPAIDGNAYRVISRMKLLDLPFNKCKKKISEFLSSHIALHRPGDFNQAIMDVGREICLPKNPVCGTCPIRYNCNAFVNNVVDKYPPIINRPPKPHYRIAVGVVWKNNHILISKRKENGLLGGLWEFPGGKIKRGESAKKCIIREIKEELGIFVQPHKFIKQIEHAYTHFSITLVAYHCDYKKGFPRPLDCSDWKWIRLEEVYNFPFPRANHMLFDALFGGVSSC